MGELSDSKILVVDDTDTNIDILVEILGDDYDVRVATDGFGALEAVSEEPPDLILLDIMMPDLDGYEVCKKLKSREDTKDIPVIFVTAMGEIENETKGLDIGAVDYITKPLSPPIVKARVHNHLQLKKAGDELKKQNEILNENIRLREDVDRIARHDLKTPLNAVITIPDLLLKEGNLNPEQSDMLKMLETSGYRMLDIINSSLDLYKMESGKYELTPVSVNIIPIIFQIQGETRDMQNARNLSLHVLSGGKEAGQEDSFVVSGEEMLCYSMLANLIKNAMEASPPGNKINILLKKQPDPVIQIHNQGVVPDEIQDRFFEKYVTAGKKGGTGLGTYSAKLITETLGGTISFQSSPEKGTIVTVKLKTISEVAKEKPTDSPEKVKNAFLNKTITILIADDYKIMRTTIMGILRQMGFSRFFSAENGKKAAEIVRTEQVNLIISDVNMPEMSGIDLLRYVREKSTQKEVPLILVTGESDKKTVQSALQLKVNDYIVKPFSSDVLMKKIEKVFT